MDTERRRGRGREGAYFVFVEWSKDTIRIQRDEEEEKVPALCVPAGWFKKMTRIQRDEEDIEMYTLYP